MAKILILKFVSSRELTKISVSFICWIPASGVDGQIVVPPFAIKKRLDFSQWWKEDDYIIFYTRNQATSKNFLNNYKML